MRVDTIAKERTTLLIIVVLFQLCYDIKLIAARSSKSRLHGAHSEHPQILVTKMGSQQNPGWNSLEQDELRLFDKEDDVLSTVVDVDRMSNGNFNMSVKTHRQLLKKQWLNLEKVPLPRLSVKLHGDFTLECEAVGSPPPVLYWTKNGQYLKVLYKTEQSEQQIRSTSFGSENKGLRLGAVTSKLKLSCIRPEDEAEYSCVAVNKEKKVMASTTLVIQEDDPSGKVTPECELRLFNFMSHGKERRRSSAYIMSWETLHMEQIGNDIVLPCRSGGHPRPKIQWTGNEGEDIVSDNKFFVSPSGDLLIKNLSWSEMGEYTCTVKNAFGSDVGSTFLYPYFEEEPE